MKRNLIAVLIAAATNLGLTRMAEASGISHDTLAWTAEWYVREEILRAANLAIVGYHQRLPLTGVFGGGTTGQHATYGTRVIVATDREAYYVLDEILGNATDLPATARSKIPHMWGTA